jgi:hypothetical protein
VTVADVCPPRCSIVSAESAASRPSRMVAARALTRRLRIEGWQPSRRTGEDQDAVTGVGRTTVRLAISWPLTPVTKMSVTVNRGYPAPQVRPCDRPGRRRFPS